MSKRSRFSRRKNAKDAVAYPPWVRLEHYPVEEVHGSSSSIADINTLAGSRTSTGCPIGVALCMAPPPETSRACVQVQLTDGVSLRSSGVLAAHGDSVLIEVVSKEDWVHETVDHFVYNSGNAAAHPPRPPSLSLLPRIPHPDEEELKDSFVWRIGCPKPRNLNSDSTGLLRRGEDELVVAELEALVLRQDTSSSQKPIELELVLFRCGEWSTKRLPVRNGGVEVTEWDLRSEWNTRKVLPVGDRLLCWSDMLHGVIFSDVFDDEPALRFVPFPTESPYGFQVCVTSGGGTVKVVNIFPHCRCGDKVGDYSSSDEEGGCVCSLNDYTIRRWMLRMDDMTWVMDGVVDATRFGPLTLTKTTHASRRAALS